MTTQTNNEKSQANSKQEGAKTHAFEAEVSQLLELVIHSLYSNKEIFLRELVSNASDAADKLRFLALENDSLYENDGDLKVKIAIDKENNTISIIDNGVGMSQDEVVTNLGTIAKSGTKEFFKNLSGDKSKDSQLIGQFGVGFYASFIVADKVDVKTRKAGTSKNEGVFWSSTGKGNFELDTIEKEQRGTEIILHLKDDAKEYLDDWKLRNLVNKYSEHINLRVEMFKEEIKEQKDDKGEITTKAEPAKWEQVNKATALWTLNKSEIKDEQYNEFYKHVSNDFENPLTWSHNKVEGKYEYTNLLYIPAKAPWDMYNREQKHGLKLYVQRVFIMDDAEQFMPVYLRFVKGVLDSNDLPLNVSREILQDNAVTQAMRKASTKKTLDMLVHLAKDDKEKYQTFWTQFGNVLKEGPAEDMNNKEKIASLLRFSSSANDSNAQTTSLDDYISRMKENQKKIYYIVADSYAAAKNSPHLEYFKKKDIEILLLSERIDEWLMQHLTEYKEKQFQSASRGTLDDIEDKPTDEAKKEKETLNNEHKDFLERIKKALGEKIKDARLSERLTDSPSCFVTDDGDMSGQMAKLMASMGQAVPETKFILELNPDHQIIKNLKEIKDDGKFATWSNLLFEQASLSEKGSIEDPSSFIKRINSLLMDK